VPHSLLLFIKVADRPERPRARAAEPAEAPRPPARTAGKHYHSTTRLNRRGGEATHVPRSIPVVLLVAALLALPATATTAARDDTLRAAAAPATAGAHVDATDRAPPRFADLPADDVLAHLALAEDLRRGMARAAAARPLAGVAGASAFDDPDLDAWLAVMLAPLGPAVAPADIPRSNADPEALARLHAALLAHARRRAGDLALDGARDDALWASSVAALWAASGRPATAADHAALAAQGRLMPAAEQQTLAPLVEAMTQAAWLARAATRDTPGPVLALLARTLDAGPAAEATPRGRALAEAAATLHDRHVHQADLFAAARLATAASASSAARPAADRARVAAGWHAPALGPLIDPLGVVAVGSFGSDDYGALGANRTYLTFDPAGNDTYTNVNVGGGALVLAFVAVPPCWVANLCLLAAPAVDAYRTVLASLWVDVEGSDTVRCRTIPNSYVPSCLGAGNMESVGIALRGAHQNATMTADVLSMGAAYIGGVGVQSSRSDYGSDKYTRQIGSTGGMGFAWQASSALLFDGGGDDQYHLGSYAQTIRNGVALFRDENGTDFYYLSNVGFGHALEPAYAEFLDTGSHFDSYGGRFAANVVASNNASWSQSWGNGQDR